MSETGEPKRIRVLIVDDSAYNRKHIADILSSSGEIEVVGKAGDGEEALRLATQLKPDVITLDLEMPRMDGFTFLRIIMARQPTHVIVVSSYKQTENTLKAIELGALDFVKKPKSQLSPDVTEIRAELLQKVLMAPKARVRRAPPPRAALPSLPQAPQAPALTQVHPRVVVGIASSTGGPTALLDIFGRLPRLPAALLIAQHMPDKFTRTFAERLDRKCRENRDESKVAFRVSEAQDNDPVLAGTAFVCPGRQCMELMALPNNEYRLRTGSPSGSDRYVPSADRLLRSVAAVAGARSVAVVLTGMGDDGVEGARAVRDAGGVVLVESPESAVVFGMPGAVVRAGLAHHVLSLPAIVDFLSSHVPL
ncbi:MAG TPA: chemotaxis response regulator protein-glutamate methylesterase [Polyangiaceae bacterium]|nr:chemotaxis response regulator protein-glutamate methylesterase [Polyangiaceae bacterium]